MFLRLASQWRYTQGKQIGLNYQSVEFLFKIFKIKNRKSLFEDLQVMELAAIRVFRAKGEENG